MNKYLRSDMEEATRTRRWLLNHDMRREKRWIVDPDRKIRIPCAWYAISVLAKRNGITCVSKHATRSHESEDGLPRLLHRLDMGNSQDGASGLPVGTIEG